MARVRCITMQRDEAVLLEPWLRWHGDLSGFENLSAFDNGWTDARTLAALAPFEQLGVKVRHDLASVGDFHGKGFHFADVIRHWNSGADYDHVFRRLRRVRGGLQPRRPELRARRHPPPPRRDRRAPLRAGRRDRPAQRLRPARLVHRDRTPTRLLARGIVAAIDFNNAITAVHGERTTRSDIVYLHHHFRARAEARARARRNLASSVDVDDPGSLRRHTGPGLHLVPHLSTTERDYMRGFDNRTLLRVPGWSLLLRALGVADPLLVDPAASREDGPSLRLPGGRGGGATGAFSPADDLAPHPDLRNGDVLALQHDLASGINEGRAVGGAAPAPAHVSARPRARGRVTTS